MTRATPDAHWMELCMDTAENGPRLGAFWAAVIGGEHRASADDPAGDVVVAEPEGGGIAMCVVPEAKTVKHRVHLDVYAASLADLEALGATVVLPAGESGRGWTIMHDPEGGEFCAFLREPDRLPPYRLHGVGIDCVDAEASARWWGERFGVEPVNHEGEDWWTLEKVTNDPVLTLDFAPVPEPKTVKNRVHWDVYGEVEAFRSAGAAVLWEQPRWTVMADPEGNEFCVFPPA
jgi:catechol 2,3-dioxygenase-like lactoylglutathione lyase family enzyme/predicted enzyme related to lactoylglutathione lyase